MCLVVVNEIQLNRIQIAHDTTRQLVHPPELKGSCQFSLAHKYKKVNK